MSLYFNKKGSPCWPRQSKPSLKLLDCSRKIQNDVHIDTYYRKPELTSWRWINITVFHTRSLSPTDQKCAESLTYWQFFYYCPPGKFRFTHLGEIFKMLWQELDIYILYIYMTLLIIDMDFLYQFNLGLIAPLFSFFLAATKQLYKWYFPSVRLSVRLSVCHTFLTMFPSSYHHEIVRSYYQWPK